MLHLADRPSRRNIARLEQVAAALARHGLAASVSRMRLSGWLSPELETRLARATRRGGDELPASWALAVRDALVELGPAFVKGGQILSVRADLVPAQLADALRTLQDRVPPVGFPEVRAAVEAELESPLETHFRWFSSTPMAAASIAQVHAAELLDGRRVAVKVKRPGTDGRVIQDLALMVWLAERLERNWPAIRKYKPVRAAEEMRRYTLRELDFRSEASVMERLRRCFARWPDVRIPEVHQATRGVLVMEWVECSPIDDLDRLHALGIDVPALVRTAVNAMLAQIYDFGLLHGDPHPGNLQVDPEGRLVFLDFGIYGELTERLKRNLTMSAMRLADGDLDLAIHYLLKVGTRSRGADPEGFREAVRELYQSWRGVAAADYGFGRMVYDQIVIAARYGIEFPPDAVVFAKALLTLEGVALTLAPDLDLSRQAAPYLRSLRWKTLMGDRWLEIAEETFPLWLDIAEELPLASETLLDRLTVRHPSHPEPAGHGTQGLFPGLIVLAGAVILAGAVPPSWGGLSLLGLSLLAAGLVLGADERRPPR